MARSVLLVCPTGHLLMTCNLPQVDSKDIMDTLKSMGEDVTQEEVDEIIAEVGNEGVIDFKAFRAGMQRPSFDLGAALSEE